MEELPDGTVASLPSIRTCPNSKTLTSIKGWWPRSVQRSPTIPLNCPFELASDVAYALTRLADILDVEMIIVGSRRGGVRAGLKQFLTGSLPPTWLIVSLGRSWLSR